MNTESRSDKSCLTTYIFNPVDTCTGTPSPPQKFSPTLKRLSSSNEIELKSLPQTRDDDFLHNNSSHMHPNFLYGKILHNGRPNFLTDYELSYKNCNFGGVDEHGKCCVGGHFGRDLSFGHLYTISKSDNNKDKEERTYDEPYAGDLPRRSWLCCPGSQQHVDCEQPSLLLEINNKSSASTTPSEIITKPPPSHNFCPATYVCININFFCLILITIRKRKKV